MKLLIRIILGVVALVVGVPVILFLIGFFGSLFGILDLPTTEPETAVTAEVQSEAPQPYQKPIEPDEVAGETVTDATPRRIELSAFPENLDERTAVEWLSANKLLLVREGLIRIDAPRFSSLTAEQALALLWAFKDAQNAATGNQRYRMQSLAVYVVMGAAYLPEAERLAFAEDGQLVSWPGSGMDRYRSGEFVLMLHLKGEPDQKRAEVAIRRFAPTLPGADILSALDRVGAMKVGDGNGDTWSYNMKKIAHLSPETLQVLRDFIGPSSRFDSDDEMEFRYAKKRLDDLIEERRGAKRE